jgi:hypothetical protein
MAKVLNSVVKKKGSVTGKPRLDTDLQIQKNTSDIKIIQHDIETIKNNHLKHIEKDIANIDKKVEKIDLRLWGIMMLIVASAIANYFM